VEPVDVAFAVVGLGALLAGILPRVLDRRPLSMPIAFLGLGMLIFLLPTGLPVPDPLTIPRSPPSHRDRVIVAGMGANARSPAAELARWSSTCAAGHRDAARIAPWPAGLVAAWCRPPRSCSVPRPHRPGPGSTQVGEPTESETRDEVRFALTEAG
jgi:hypothetical protein